MIDWKRKLTSRKFWLTIISFVTLILIFFKVDKGTAEQVAAIIMAGASIIAYIIGEGLADGMHANDNPEEEDFETESEDEPKDGEETGFEDEEEET